MQKKESRPKRRRNEGSFEKREHRRVVTKKEVSKALEPESVIGMRLNKYVAHCGVCSRRQAADLVKSGKIMVNGKVQTEPFYQIQKNDTVQYEGKTIRPEKQLVYVLMNKPKNVLTTTSDERGRTTVMDILGEEITERIYPIGRLDRDTTGLLLLTNDGELAQSLSHPSKKIKKVYQVLLDKPLTKNHLMDIAKGVELEDGVAMVDNIGFIEEKSKNEVLIEIHIGKNRIVRRIFEHLGYNVEKLDRTHYAGLTKKDLPRGRFRFLTEREVIMLKHFNKG